jgi:hypothetical protein
MLQEQLQFAMMGGSVIPRIVVGRVHIMAE